MDGCFRSCWLILFSVFLVVTKFQILANGIVRIVDLLTATAGFQVDFDADVINGHSLQAQTNDLGVAGVLPIEMS